MAAIIEFKCDECGHIQPLIFENLYDTWGLMINFLMNLGWRVEMSKSQIVKCFCPKHKV